MLMPYYTTKLGNLYNRDAIEIMRNLEDESVDLIVADPPYNSTCELGAIMKLYGLVVGLSGHSIEWEVISDYELYDGGLIDKLKDEGYEVWFWGYD